MSVMHINYDGKEYTFDLEEIDVRQAGIIKDKCGLTLMGLEAGLSEGDPAALRAVYWLMLCQNEEKADIEQVNFKIVKFARAVDAASTTEDDEAEAPKGKTTTQQ